MQIDPVSDMLTPHPQRDGRTPLQGRDPGVQTQDRDRADPEKKKAYIANYRIAEEGSKTTIKAYLKYGSDTRPVISRIERVSKPGRRVFVGSKEVPRVIGGMGVNILSTSSGVMTGAQARKKGSRRRNRLQHLLGAYVASRVSNRSACPLRQRSKSTPGRLDVKGPKGTLSLSHPRGHRVRLQRWGCLPPSADVTLTPLYTG